VTGPLASHDIEAAFLAACRAELAALKPGNVHRHSAGHGMEVAHFERAAELAAGPIANGVLSVGQRILEATKASVASTGLNINLGIVLLAAPLAKAAAETTIGLGLRRRLDQILSHLNEQDAEDAFAAIRLANPAGLGNVEDGDVHEQKPITLIAAMRLAADRDRIANAYVTAYSDVFDFALPALQEIREATQDQDLAVTSLHMTMLAEFLDTHIIRKHGPTVAENVRERARALTPQWAPAASQKSISKLAEFDAELKSSGLNPGTTADFVVTTLFAEALMGRKHL
jgi:triphosphoribosyl-dephospho-CoA synthase